VAAVPIWMNAPAPLMFPSEIGVVVLSTTRVPSSTTLSATPASDPPKSKLLSPEYEASTLVVTLPRSAAAVAGPTAAAMACTGAPLPSCNVAPAPMVVVP
jgi:hypothetical protein